MSRARLALLTSLGILCASAGPARAYEDQASIGVLLAYGHAVSDVTPTHGAVLGLGASLGLSDVWTVRGQLSGALHPSPAQTVSILSLSAELLYVIDVLELVPYFGAGLSGVANEAYDFEPDLGIHPVVGVDWLLSREVTVGLQLRPVLMVTAFERDPLYLEAGVSVAYLIDLF